MTEGRWYTFEPDRSGVMTTRFELSSGTFRSGAASSRLFRQLRDLGLPDGSLREVVEAAVAWRDQAPAEIARRAKPAHIKEKEESPLVVELFLRALGYSWDQSLELGRIYRPPKSAVAALSESTLSEAHWPEQRGASEPVEWTRADQKTVVARLPLTAFRAAGVQPDGRFAQVQGEKVLVSVSPGAEKCVRWLLAHVEDPEIAPYLTNPQDPVDEASLVARAAHVASRTRSHPTRTGDAYPDTLWSDAVARALDLPEELWERMEKGAKVSAPTWHRAR
jgi:hypothetical protein